MKTYKSPVPKIAEIANLRLTGSLSFHTANTGNKSIEKSETTFMTDVAIINASLSRHVPGTPGFCIMARGLQLNMKEKKIVI